MENPSLESEILGSSTSLLEKAAISVDKDVREPSGAVRVFHLPSGMYLPVSPKVAMGQRGTKLMEVYSWDMLG